MLRERVRAEPDAQRRDNANTVLVVLVRGNL
jgi:hypothetical protein